MSRQSASVSIAEGVLELEPAVIEIVVANATRRTISPLPTNVTGIQFTELLPLTARFADKLAIIRSMRHDNASHNAALARSLCERASPVT